MTYLVVVMGFYYSGYTTMDALGVDPSNTLALPSWQMPGDFVTAGMSRSRGEL